MKIHSIRLKMMLPVVMLATLLLGLFVFMQALLKYESDAMKTQTQSYFEAIATVLNADRDIYQARLAQAELLTDYGDKDLQQQDFQDNADQVLARFKKYRNYLKDEPELLEPFKNFEQLYNQWLESSTIVTKTYKAKIHISSKMTPLDKNFYILRNMLDDIERELRSTAANWGEDEISQANLDLYLNAIAKVLNADRDMYQARLAQQDLLAGVGDYNENKIQFEENAFQALNRFQSFKSLMENESQFADKFGDFTVIFSQWFKDSLTLIESDNVRELTSKENILNEVDQSFSKIRDLLDKAGEVVRQHGRDMEKEVLDTIAYVQNIAVGVIVIGFIIAFAMGFIIPKKITDEVNSISKRIKEISEGDGDLTARINSNSKDELGVLSSEFDSFLNNLQSIMQVIQSKSSALGNSTHQLDTVANTVNEITQVLVDSFNSIVSAANEMSMSNDQMANVATNTSEQSTKASENIEQGRQVVRSSHTSIDALVSNIDITMTKAQELEKSSQSISSVLEVIRGIAEQTNLLALNAAIEAARAGELGRGFAVVADEVRTLATQTSESTNQIEQMMNQFTTSVDDAFNAVKMSKGNANDAVENFDNVITVFDTLNEALNGVRDLSEQTAQATNEQSTVSHEINQNLVSMKDQTDGVDHAANEIRSQFDNLNNLYLELDEQVSKFKV